MNAARRCTLPTVYRTLRPQGSHSNANGDRENESKNIFDAEQGENTQLARLHPQSALQVAAPPAMCVFQELVASNGAFLRHVSAIDGAWLSTYFASGVTRRELLQLCGRKLDDDTQNKLPENELQQHSASNTKEKKQTRVSEDAVAAARARFLVRKRQK